ncbi:sepiapterin reductase-like [Pocillopora verrucosa]|uniref:sepiapterin reductase-like n=1 Tax=Pocillopora verrucosa TaxID=203993 RepID=UPI00333E34ED
MGGLLSVHVMVADLGEMSTLEDSIKAALCKVESSKVTHAFLLNNAGSLGDVSKCFKDVSQKVDALANYFNLSPLFLTGKFLHQFKDSCCTVVNVSSLMALQSFPYFSLYCTGKAARDMMCQVLAKEEPNVNVLSYAPGPLLTDMYEEIRTTCGNQEVVDMFNTSKEQSTALTSDQSAEKLVRILKENAFISGSHVDYFD